MPITGFRSDLRCVRRIFPSLFDTIQLIRIKFRKDSDESDKFFEYGWLMGCLHDIAMCVITTLTSKHPHAPTCQQVLQPERLLHIRYTRNPSDNGVDSDEEVISGIDVDELIELVRLIYQDYDVKRSSQPVKPSLSKLEYTLMIQVIEMKFRKVMMDVVIWDCFQGDRYNSPNYREDVNTGWDWAQDHSQQALGPWFSRCPTPDPNWPAITLDPLLEPGLPVPTHLYCTPYTDSEQPEGLCSICLDELVNTANGRIVAARCKGAHLFHDECLDSWINHCLVKSLNTCPCDRQRICPPRAKIHPGLMPFEFDPRLYPGNPRDKDPPVLQGYSWEDLDDYSSDLDPEEPIQDWDTDDELTDLEDEELDLNNDDDVGDDQEHSDMDISDLRPAELDRLDGLDPDSDMDEDYQHTDMSLGNSNLNSAGLGVSDSTPRPTNLRGYGNSGTANVRPGYGSLRTVNSGLGHGTADSVNMSMGFVNGGPANMTMSHGNLGPANLSTGYGNSGSVNSSMDHVNGRPANMAVGYGSLSPTNTDTAHSNLSSANLGTGYSNLSFANSDTGYGNPGLANSSMGYVNGGPSNFGTGYSNPISTNSGYNNLDAPLRGSRIDCNNLDYSDWDIEANNRFNSSGSGIRANNLNPANSRTENDEVEEARDHVPELFLHPRPDPHERASRCPQCEICRQARHKSCPLP